MILDNNCINQLAITSQDSQRCSSVFNLIDHTSTAMGKRLLREKLLLPLINKDLIEERYNYTEFLRQETSSQTDMLKHLDGHKKYYLFQLYESHLKNIFDIERLHRKMCMGLLQPCEFTQLSASYDQVIAILDLITTNAHDTIKRLFNPDLKPTLTQYIQYYSGILDVAEASKYNINTITNSFFKRGYNKEIDELQDQITEYESYFQQLTSMMSNIISKSNDTMVSYTHGEGIGYHLEVTMARYKVFESKYTVPLIINTSNYTYTINKSELDVIANRAGKTCKITSNEIKSISSSFFSCSL
jgi:DNA mismatch repair protein MutS